MNPQIEELQKKKAGLESELQSLTEQEQNLDDKVKILEEKVSIQDLNSKIKARKDAIGQFEVRVKELEEKLENPWKEEAPAQWQEPTQQTEPDVEAEAEPEPETIEETPMDDGIAVFEPESPKAEHQEPKRKRKFF